MHADSSVLSLLQWKNGRRPLGVPELSRIRDQAEANLARRFYPGIAMAPGFRIERRHPTRPRAVAPMLPQELLGVSPDHLFDRAEKAARVFLDIRLSVAALLERDEVLDDDAVVAIVRLAHDEDRHHQCLGFLHQPRKRARGRSRFAEEWNEYRLAALGVLIERDADQLAVAERLEHGARGRPLAHHVDAGALAHPGHQGVTRQEALRVMDEGYLMAVKSVGGSQKFEVAEVGAEHDDAAARIAPFQL